MELDYKENKGFRLLQLYERLSRGGILNDGAVRWLALILALAQRMPEVKLYERKIMKKTKFTMLGMTGSGKTCYLLGMYKKMLGGLKGFSLTTDDDTDGELRTRYSKMDDASLGQKRFPPGTDQTDTYEFTLEYAFSPIMSFSWIDYPGGALVEKVHGDLEQYNILKQHIRESDSLFICVDGALLQGDRANEDKVELIREKCSSAINPFLSRYLRENHVLPPTALVITKTDLLGTSVTNADLKEILEDAFSPLFAQGRNTNSLVAIISVSLGARISENECTGVLAPIGLEIPIFMGIWFALCEAVSASENAMAKMKALREVAARERKEEEESFFLLQDDDKIARLNRNIHELDAALQEEEEALRDASYNAGQLLEHLREKIALVYYNGTEYDSFKEAAEMYRSAARQN